MILIPAIDLKNKKCVRLKQGNYNDVTIFGDPILMAKKWQEEGASLLHIVDLDGAKDGKLCNYDIIKRIIGEININLEVGGGIRTLNQIEDLLNIGVYRIILGSIAVKNIDLVKEAINKFGSDKIVIGLDTKNFQVAINGWLEVTSIDALTFALKLQNIGVKTIIFTDIAKDGMLKGINLEQTKTLVDGTNLNIIASGGIAKLDDIKLVQDIGCNGVILGKSLYTNQFSLKDALIKFGD